MNERGRSQSRYCIAHIWCWPTPVVQTTSRSTVSAWSVSSTSWGLSDVLASAVAKRELLSPGGELAQPRLRAGHGARTADCAQLLREVGKRLLQGPDHREIRLTELGNLGRVDVEVDDRRAGGEGRELAGDAIVEARTDRDQEVALVHRPVRPLRPVHPRPAEVELVGLGEGALAHERGDDRELPGLGELAQLVARVGVERSAADVEDGPFGRGQGLRGSPDLAGLCDVRRVPAGKVEALRVGEVELRLLDVAWDVNENRTRPPRPRDVERGLERVRQLLDVLDEPRMLDDRDGDPGDVALLERIRPDQVRPHLPGDAHERRRVHPRVGDRRHEVRRARPRGGESDADPPGCACVPLRHVPGALLVPREHVADGGAPGERVVRGQDSAAREPEDDVDALGLEGAEDRVGAVHLSCNGLAVELGVRQRERQLGEHDVGELARRRAQPSR